MALPQFQTNDKNFALMQNTWATQLNPLLMAPLSSALILSNIPLTAGSNVVNHKLGRELQGWMVVRQRGQASFFDTQDLNPSPSLTLYLTASSGVSVDLIVF